MRWIVGYPPGGASDTFARLIGGQHGARGSARTWWWRTGPAAAPWWPARPSPAAPADGYTLMHVDNGILVYNPALYARLPYDPDRDFAGVGFIGRFPLFIVVRPDSPVADFAGLVAASKHAGAELWHARRRLAAPPGDGDGQAPHRAAGDARALSRRPGGDAGPAGRQCGHAS